MFDDIKRKNEIAKVLYWAGGVIPSAPFNDIISEILSQEKLMIEQLESKILYLEDLDNHKHYGDKWLIELIEQAKKEAVKEFAEKYKIILNDRSIRSARYLKEEFYKLLKEYEVTL